MLRHVRGAADEASVALSRRPRPIVLRLAGAIALALLGVSLLGVQGASAQVVKAEGVTVGLLPRSTVQPNSGVGFENATGAPVIPSSKVYAIYWDPMDLYHGDWQHLIDRFLHNMGAAGSAPNNVFAVDSQYTDAAGAHAGRETMFEGAYTDTTAYPTAGTCLDPAPLLGGDAVTCLSDAQIRAQLEAFIKAHALPTGMGAIYYVLTPPGVTTCLGALAEHCSDYEGLVGEASYQRSFCSYHSYIGGSEPGGPGTILYAVMPWTAGGLGDYHLAEANRTPAYDCQAGGWEPVSESPPFKQEAESTQQEPNQIGLGPDGYYDTGLADLIVSQIGVQQQNIVTDPLLDAWQSASGREVTDECRNYFAPSLGGVSAAKEHTEAGTLYNQSLGEGNYYINDSFDLADGQLPYPDVTPCRNQINLVPQFTTPNVINSGELVGFDGMESDVTLNAGTKYESGKAVTTWPVYEWSFGDGSSVKGYAPGAPTLDSPSTSPCELPWVAPCAASAFHSYEYGGTYTVTLKITDTGGNTATISQPVIVTGPLPPGSSEPGGSPGSPGGSGQTGGSGGSSSAGSSVSSPSGSSGSPSSGSSGGSTTTKSKSGASGKSGTGSKSGKSKMGNSKPLPRPVATALVETKSLPEALSKGLLVRYSVNQQAAGQFEVLMGRKLAYRLHIKGPEARGLPKGAKRQILIALHLLVTMHKAHGELRIIIPKHVGSQLRKLHRLTLTLRLVVRNASREKPKATLVRAVVKLSR